METLVLPAMNDLYKDRTIFITGASGFVGKVLIEKMLYSLPGIKRIYILIRESRGKSGAERWKEFEKIELFNRIRRDCPDHLSKVVTVEGDITLPDYGLAEEDLHAVLEETSMVFHCAATVKFNAPLSEAVDMNMRGVARMLSLCHRMPKLACLLHCSTCYVNADKRWTIVEEKVYPPPCDPHKLLEDAELVPETSLENVTKNYGNTYCFTKALSEHLVLDESADLPIIIFRPSIIGGIWKDGIPGWADAFQGAAAMAIAFCTGAITRIPIDLKSRIDGIPVDVVSSSMIVCAGYRMTMRGNSTPIVHCNSTSLNPVILENIRTRVIETAYKYPFENILSTPVFSHLGSDTVERSMHKMREKYLGPALDTLGSFAGQKPLLYRRVGEAYASFNQFFSGYTFTTDNLVLLMGMMTEEDKETFDFDVRKINWNDYGFDVYIATKVFLMKDDIVNYEMVRKARRTLKFVQMKDFVSTLLICYLCTALLTGSTTSWQIFLPLTVIMHCYCTLFLYTPSGDVPSIHEYKRRVEEVMGEPLKPMKRKN